MAQNSKDFLAELLQKAQRENDIRLAQQLGKNLANIPEEGFIRLPKPVQELSSHDKILLTRKANEMFNQGNFSQAEKIFLAVGYSSGLSKLAETHFEKNDFIRALLLFRAAHDEQRAEALTQRFVQVIRKWLRSSS